MSTFDDKNSIYVKACDAFSNKNYQEALELFASLDGWLDSNEKTQACRKRIDNPHYDEERQEKQQKSKNYVERKEESQHQWIRRRQKIQKTNPTDDLGDSRPEKDNDSGIDNRPGNIDLKQKLISEITSHKAGKGEKNKHTASHYAGVIGILIIVATLVAFVAKSCNSKPRTSSSYPPAISQGNDVQVPSQNMAVDDKESAEESTGFADEAHFSVPSEIPSTNMTSISERPGTTFHFDGLDYHYYNHTLVVSGRGFVYTGSDAISSWEEEIKPYVTTIILENGVTGISDWAFEGCSNLYDIVLPDSLENIGEWAFQNCSNLSALQIPKSVTTIGSGAFDHCTKLSSVKIPDGVEKISWYAFNGCTSLKNVYIPKSVTFIDDGAFYGCSSLLDVYYDGSRQEWESVYIIGVNDANVSLQSATIHYG